MTIHLTVVDDVPASFAEVVEGERPRTFALSGGSTARACYERLRAGVDWSGTRFLLSDERWVSVAHPASNEGQARRVWLDHVPTGGVLSLRSAGDTRAHAADAYDALLEGLGTVDLLHLSLGTDGHVASLFPGAPQLDVRDRLVVPSGDGLHDWPRLTFTYRAIERCTVVVVTVAGAGKRAALARVRSGDPTLPATHLRAPRILWLVDAGAAGTGE
jgi:6-phosphogluconolactonase